MSYSLSVSLPLRFYLLFSRNNALTISTRTSISTKQDRIRPHLSNAKLAVTGGFRSLAAMNEALSAKSCDIVGVARPLTAEPALSRDLCDGKSQGAKENLVPSAIQTGSSIAQIKEVRRLSLTLSWASSFSDSLEERG